MMDFQWRENGLVIVDDDSVAAHHQGVYSIPTLHTHDRYLFAWHGEECCGEDFVLLFCHQFHPRMVLGENMHNFGHPLESVRPSLIFRNLLLSC